MDGGSYSDHHFPVLLYSNGEDNRLLTEDQALVFMIANNVSDLDVREVSTHIYFKYIRYNVLIDVMMILL